MSAYIVTRHGCNAANQSMTPAMVVGTYDAANSQAAIAAAKEDVTVYANQYLSALPYSRASKAQRQEARDLWEREAYRDAMETS